MRSPYKYDTWIDPAKLCFLGAIDEYYYPELVLDFPKHNCLSTSLDAIGPTSCGWFFFKVIQIKRIIECTTWDNCRSQQMLKGWR